MIELIISVKMSHVPSWTGAGAHRDMALAVAPRTASCFNFPVTTLAPVAVRNTRFYNSAAHNLSCVLASGRNGFSPQKEGYCSITQLFSRPMALKSRLVSQEPFSAQCENPVVQHRVRRSRFPFRGAIAANKETTPLQSGSFER